jgi:tetratricopeptide (TPR) repeat protein
MADDPTPQLVEGIQLAKEQKFDDALRIFNKITESYPDNDIVWVAKGKVLANLGRNMDAYQAFDTALKINPGNNSAKSNINVIVQHINEEIPMPEPIAIAPDYNPRLVQTPISIEPEYKSNIFLFIWPFIGVLFIFGGIVGILVMLFMSALIIAADARTIHAGRVDKSEMGSMVTWKPSEWFFLIILFLIIFYPIYLVKRRDIFKSNYNASLFERGSPSILEWIVGIVFGLVIGLIIVLILR